MSIFLDAFRLLTDAFTKNPDSNIGKMLLLVSGEIDELNDTLNKIESWRDIDQAAGVTLDLIGENVGQSRGQATDEVMRVLIRAKIARNTSDGSMDSVINALALSLNADPSTIQIVELYDDTESEPAAIAITGLPLAAINRAGMTVNQFGQIAQRVVAAGVRVATIDIQGTFQLSGVLNDSQMDASIGLAPLDQSVGGTLSGAFTPEEEIPLPI